MTRKQKCLAWLVFLDVMLPIGCGTEVQDPVPQAASGPDQAGWAIRRVFRFEAGSGNRTRDVLILREPDGREHLVITGYSSEQWTEHHRSGTVNVTHEEEE